MTLTEKLWTVLTHGPGPGDPRTTSLLLMDSPWNIVLILLSYIVLVYWIGPHWMNRYDEPLDTYSYLVWHNLFLVFTNGMFGLALAISMFLANYNILCEPVSDKGVADDTVAYLLYGLFLLKLFELIDALTLVCKKVDPPFILVFHHTTIVAMVWIGVKYGPGGSATFPTLLNSWVHVLIYLHFKFSRQYLSSHQARKIFVMIYFVQFILVTFVSATVLFLQCGYPEWIALLTVLYNVILMAVYFRSMWSLWCGGSSSGGPDEPVSSSSDEEPDEVDESAVSRSKNKLVTAATQTVNSANKFD